MSTPTSVTSASTASNRNSVLALDPNRSRRAWIEGSFFQRVAMRRRVDHFKPAARRPIFRNWSRASAASSSPVDECAKFDAVMAAWESAAERGWRRDRDVALPAEPAAWLWVVHVVSRWLVASPLSPNCNILLHRDNRRSGPISDIPGRSKHRELGGRTRY